VIILLPLRLVYRIAPSTVCFIRSKDAVANKLAFIAAVIVLLTVFLAQGIAFIHANSQTFDEAVHLAAGYSYLTKHDFHLNFEHPPLIKELAALPVMLWYHLPFEPDPALWSASREFRIGKDFLYGNEIPGQDLLILGRLPNLVLGAVLIGVMAIWVHLSHPVLCLGIHWLSVELAPWRHRTYHGPGPRDQRLDGILAGRRGDSYGSLRSLGQLIVIFRCRKEKGRQANRAPLSRGGTINLPGHESGCRCHCRLLFLPERFFTLVGRVAVSAATSATGTP
jgi:hypothetical protein